MSLHSVPKFPDHIPVTLHENQAAPLCSICNQAVALENCNSDERGLAVHENCYVLKLGLEEPARCREVAQ